MVAETNGETVKGKPVDTDTGKATGKLNPRTHLLQEITMKSYGSEDNELFMVSSDWEERRTITLSGFDRLAEDFVPVELRVQTRNATTIKAVTTTETRLMGPKGRTIEIKIVPRKSSKKKQAKRPDQQNASARVTMS